MAATDVSAAWATYKKMLVLSRMINGSMQRSIDQLCQQLIAGFEGLLPLELSFRDQEAQVPLFLALADRVAADRLQRALQNVWRSRERHRLAALCAPAEALDQQQKKVSEFAAVALSVFPFLGLHRQPDGVNTRQPIDDELVEQVPLATRDLKAHVFLPPRDCPGCRGDRFRCCRGTGASAAGGVESSEYSKTVSHPMGCAEPFGFEVCARALKGLAHPIRLAVVVALEQRELSPAQFARGRGEPVSNVSYHFRRLAELGWIELVRTRPAGGSIEHIYRLVESGK